MDKVTLGQVYLRAMLFLSVDIIPPWPSILIYHLGDKQQARWWSQFRDILTP
jgi:hypothetical protein